MSYRAIAAALALEELSIGQRLTVFSLASFANRQHRAWPAAATAAARAGLSRRQYLTARAELEQRGLISTEPMDGRIGSSGLTHLVFAGQGPSIEREINAELFESTLARSGSRGGARVLLAVLAALADRDRVVDGLSVEELSLAGGLSDSTYRRARAQLLAAGEIELPETGGGRSRCNTWRVVAGSEDVASQHANESAIAAISECEDEQLLTSENPVTNPVVNPGQNRTPARAETPPETPSSRARAGKESQNQRTTPPDPPEGGQRDRVVIVEDFVSSRGRHRQRQTAADPAAELSAIGDVERRHWSICRELLRERLGASIFDIWLASFELVAVSRKDRALLIGGRPEAAVWVGGRYGRVLASLADFVGRPVRVISDRERQMLAHVSADARNPLTVSSTSRHDHQEVS